MTFQCQSILIDHVNSTRSERNAASAEKKFFSRHRRAVVHTSNLSLSEELAVMIVFQA